MQLSALSLAMTRVMSGAYTPSALFAAGEQAVWFDPSDISTLYQYAAGTTPVTAMEQPVGLMLDKSKGLVLGSELVTNGDFSNGTTGWTGSSAVFTLSVVDGWGRCVNNDPAAAGNADITNTVSGLTSGVTYKVTFNSRVSLSGSAQPYTFIINGVSVGYGITPSEYSAVFTATGTTATFVLRRRSGNGGVAGDYVEIDNISVKELPGNHCVFKSGTGRPVLSARYNLLTYTEQFDNAAWVKEGTTTAPAAKTIAFAAGSAGANRIRQAATVLFRENTSWRFSITVPASSGWTDGSAKLYLCSSTSTANPLVITPSAVEQRVVFTEVNPSAGTSVTMLLWADKNVTVTGIYAADIRASNDGIGLPAYQRVVASATYDTAGFPAYLRADGTDDGGSTNSIDFTGTDKITVFAGVRKLSDAAKGIVAEFSATTVSNNGTYALTAPNAASATYGFESKGTALTDAIASATAPISSVISASGGISTDSNVIRVNGTQSDSDTGDQGTGNYGNYPLFLFARNNANLYFNGRLYGLIVLGRAATAMEIANTERYLNQRGRIY